MQVSKNFYKKVLKKIYPSYRFSWQVYSDKLDELSGKQKVWLDAGCGRNVTIRDFPAKYSLGIDLEVHPELENEHRFIKGSLDDLPFRGGVFDLLTAHFVVEHLDYPDVVFKEFSRVLKPGGCLLIRTTNRLNYAFFIASLIPNGLRRRIVRAVYGRQVDIYQTRYRLNTPIALRKISLTSGLGLESVVMTENLHLVHPLVFAVSLVIERILSIGPLRNLKNMIVAVYRKPILHPFGAKFPSHEVPCVTLAFSLFLE